MSSTRMIDEAEATGKTRSFFEGIKASLGIDFVPDMHRAMAVKPSFLEANWNEVKAVMQSPGKLNALTKEVIAAAVSAVMGCWY